MGWEALVHIWVFTEMEVSTNPALQLCSSVWYSASVLHLLIICNITEVLISFFLLLEPMCYLY